MKDKYNSMVKALGFKNYKEYLQSYLWLSKREYFIKKKCYKCEKCGEEATQVHHKNYDNITNEKQEDLMALCKKCHQKVHNIK